MNLLPREGKKSAATEINILNWIDTLEISLIYCSDPFEVMLTLIELDA